MVDSAWWERAWEISKSSYQSSLVEICTNQVVRIDGQPNDYRIGTING